MLAVEVDRFKAFDCLTCTARDKMVRGCSEDVPKHFAFTFQGVEHRRCPRRPILDDPGLYGDVFYQYRQKEKGFLPEAGGLMDQPAVLVQAWQEIDRTLSAIDQYKKDEEASKRRTKAAQRASAEQRRGRRR